MHAVWLRLVMLCGCVHDNIIVPRQLFNLEVSNDSLAPIGKQFQSDNSYLSSNRQGSFPSCSIREIVGKVTLMIAGKLDALPNELPVDCGFLGCASVMCGF